MSTVAEPPASGAPPSGAKGSQPAEFEPPGSQPAGSKAECANCASPLAEDQEWCLECGAARTLIHRPPDWRVPLAVIGLVLVLVLVAFGIALSSLSADVNRSAAVQGSQPRAAAAPTPARGHNPAPATPAPVTIASWPTGLSGWTVVLARKRIEARANTVAQRIGASRTQVGVLDSTQHPSMTPGFWIVFSGRYPDRPAAVAAASALRAQGNRGAVASRVAPPGGI